MEKKKKNRRETKHGGGHAKAWRARDDNKLVVITFCFEAEANYIVSGRREKKVKTHNLFAQSFALLVFRAGDTHAALFSCCCCCCPAPSDTGS